MDIVQWMESTIIRIEWTIQQLKKNVTTYIRGISDDHDEVDLCYMLKWHTDPKHIYKLAKPSPDGNQEILSSKIRELDYGEVIPSFAESEIAEFQTVNIHEPVCLSHD